MPTARSTISNPTAKAERIRTDRVWNLTLTLTENAAHPGKYDACVSPTRTATSAISTGGVRCGRSKTISSETSAVTIAFDESIDAFPIDSVTDGAGRKYVYHYTGDGTTTPIRLSSISHHGTGETPLYTVGFTQNDAGDLTGIAYPDGESASFAYAGDSLLCAAQDTSGARIEYGYNSTATAKLNRVT